MDENIVVKEISKVREMLLTLHGGLDIGTLCHVWGRYFLTPVGNCKTDSRFEGLEPDVTEYQGSTKDYLYTTSGIQFFKVGSNFALQLMEGAKVNVGLGAEAKIKYKVQKEYSAVVSIKGEQKYYLGNGTDFGNKIVELYKDEKWRRDEYIITNKNTVQKASILIIEEKNLEGTLDISGKVDANGIWTVGGDDLLELMKSSLSSSVQDVKIKPGSVLFNLPSCVWWENWTEYWNFRTRKHAIFVPYIPFE